VESSCEYGDEPMGSGTTELVMLRKLTASSVRFVMHLALVVVVLG
jgi:hypothetical protein